MKREGDNWRFRFCWASARRGFLWRKLKLFWSWAVESALTFSLPNSASYRFCTECTPKKLYVFYFTKDMCIRNIKCWTLKSCILNQMFTQCETEEQAEGLALSLDGMMCHRIDSSMDGVLSCLRYVLILILFNIWSNSAHWSKGGPELELDSGQYLLPYYLTLLQCALE